MKEKGKWWFKVKSRFLKRAAAKSFGGGISLKSEFIAPEAADLLARLREYFLLAGEPDFRLNPRWLAARLRIAENDLLSALAYAVCDGLVELHWEVYCPSCGSCAADYASLRESRGEIECRTCESEFETHLDRDVRVTFSASESFRRLRSDSPVLMPLESARHAPTRGLDLLLIPSFHKLFSGEAPPLNESLKISRVTILFTDLRGSTAMYAERGDPKAYRMVREHFDILREAIERHRGVFIKTIGDSVMASFASGADAVRAAFAAQAELRGQVAEIGGELILKAGIHAGACLVVNLNNQLDFFGTAVNTAARVQTVSCGNDVAVTDTVFDEAETEITRFCSAENLAVKLRGLTEPVHIRRLTSG